MAGTKAEAVIEIIRKIPESQRKKVTEITLDMAGSMGGGPLLLTTEVPMHRQNLSMQK